MFQNEKKKKKKKEKFNHPIETGLWSVSFEIDENARWSNPSSGGSLPEETPRPPVKSPV